VHFGFGFEGLHEDPVGLNFGVLLGWDIEHASNISVQYWCSSIVGILS
jgi:hypothetical protein